MTIDAEDRFPHSVVPLVLCIICHRRLTIVVPSNTSIDEVTCPCGSTGKFVRVKD